MARYIPPKLLPLVQKSEYLLVELPPQQVGFFRYLLEGYDNLAQFTVLEPRKALLKLIFSPHQRGQVTDALKAVGDSIELKILPYPF